MIRREFIALLGGAAAAWPLTAHAQRPTMPVAGVVSGQSENADAHNAAAFRKGLAETGYVDGQNVTIEYHWLDGQYNRLPALMADLVHRQVTLIATIGSVPAALAEGRNSNNPDRLRCRREPGQARSRRQHTPAGR